MRRASILTKSYSNPQILFRLQCIVLLVVCFACLFVCLFVLCFTCCLFYLYVLFGVCYLLVSLFLQSLHDGFDSWLDKCEDQLANPVRMEGDPAEITRQLNDLKVLPSTARAL